MAVRFDAATDAYAATSGLPASTTWSITWWQYQTSDRNDYSGSVSLSNAGGTQVVFVETDVDGTTWKVWDIATNAAGLGSFSPGIGVWCKMALVCSGTTVTWYYAAAGAALTTTSAATFTPPSTPGRLSLGSDFAATSTSFLDGRIAAVKMWQAALTAAEVGVELGQYVPVRVTNLQRFHHFVGAGTADSSGSGNTLTAGSTSTTTEDGPPIPWMVIPVPYNRPSLLSQLPRIRRSALY